MKASLFILTATLLFPCCNGFCEQPPDRVVQLPPEFIVNGLSRLKLNAAGTYEDLEPIAKAHYDAVVSGQITLQDSDGSKIGPRGKFHSWFCTRGYHASPGVYVVIVILEDDEGGQILLDRWAKDEDGNWKVEPFFPEPDAKSE